MRLTKTLVAAAVLAVGLSWASPVAAQRGGGRHGGGGRSATSAPHGTAVARPPAVVHGGSVYGGRPVVVAPYRGYYRPYYYRPYYYPNYRAYYAYPYGYGGLGLSFGLFYGYPYGYAYPYAYPYPYAYGPPYPYAYPPSYGTYGSVGVQAYGVIRIDLPQRDAEVYVDGNFYGTLDQNNGSFNLEPGSHHIEVRAAGFAPAAFDVNVVPGRTITYRTPLRPQ
jgi:PEGA domain-containing protein